MKAIFSFAILQTVILLFSGYLVILLAVIVFFCRLFSFGI